MLLRFERELQKFHPNVTIPYWDSTVDRSPSDPLWNNNFLGQFNSAWDLRRAFGAAPGSSLPTPQQVETNQGRGTYDAFSRELEDPIHNSPHRWVGGVMGGVASPGDPVFYLHHCWIDLLWARWQLAHPGAPFVPWSDPPGVAGIGLNDPLTEWPDRTPANVLDHHALGYAYDIWLNMGKPPGVNLRAFMGAVTLMDTPASPQRPHVFVEGNDYNLWCRCSDGANWHWLNMGKPPGVNLRAFMGAVTLMDTPASPQRPHVFVEGNDYNLWCRWSDGANWHWLNMGKPPGVNLRAFMGAVTLMDTPASPQRPHVFVEGNDYNLWCRCSDGANWHWLNMGKPPGVNIRAFMGAVTLMDTPASPQRPHVFVEGNDYNLWCRYSDGADWHWLNMGKPPGVNLRAFMGAVTLMDTPASPQRPHVFVECNDYNLWCRYSDGADWHWLNMGKPPGVNIRAFMGAVTLMDTPTSPQRPHVFVECNDYNLWCRYSDGADWHWLNMGKPPGVNLRAMMGAVTVMDTPTSPQRSHVFVEGNDYNLWCDWSG